MWRSNDVDGPQGPMQVSAAAAFDVGGGNRFDVYENLLLGRAYLARLFRRFGNWSDTIAAYNWGPGNVDQWIARGRNAAQLPAETTRYIERVLQQAFSGSMVGMAQRISKQ
jgi:soluble lytic murein transglycosylase-like protein